jgi:hypothetical protein
MTMRARTTGASVGPSGTVRSPCVSELPVELTDAITEAVAPPDDAVLRAAVIHEIIEQVVDAVAWRHGSRPYGPERDSLAALLAAADDHTTRMMLSATSSPSTVGLGVRRDQ